MFLYSLLDEETPWYPFNFETPFDTARAVVIWLTVALLLAFAICFLIFKGEKRKTFCKISGFTAILYACAVGITLLILSFIFDGFEAILFYPILCLILAIAASALLLYFRRNAAAYIVSCCLCGAALIATLVCMGFHFASGDAAENNWITNSDVNTVGLYVSAAVLLAAVIAIAFLCGRHAKKGFSTRSITFAAVCIAMSFALSYIRIVKMPQGGSITVASLLPLMIYSYMFGTKKGLLAGMIYGILQAFQDTYILHPAQFLLDYPLAFSCIGLAGMFANSKALKVLPVRFACGTIVAGIGRFLMHFLSGIFAFGAFATFEPIWLYSLSYQAGYVLPDIAIAIVIGVFVFSSKAFAHELQRYSENTLPVKAALPAAETAAADASSCEQTASANEQNGKATGAKPSSDNSSARPDSTN